eukprot:2716482-Alexandrium_andersonii.AAC.1
MAQSRVKAMGLTAVLSPTNPEAEATSGGVGILVRHPLGVQVCEPRSTAFAEAHRLGRAVMAIVALGGSVPALIVSFYGWASDGLDFRKADRTAALMASILEELSLWPSMPCIVAGDMNASANSVAPVASALARGDLLDIGHLAPAWGAEADLPTSWAHNAKAPTRIDHVFCNVEASLLVRSFRHLGFGKFDVHAPLCLGLSCDKPAPAR